MNEELKALDNNETWQIAHLPPKKSVIGCKWIFKTKLKSDGTKEGYKTRVIVQGYS